MINFLFDTARSFWDALVDLVRTQLRHFAERALNWLLEQVRGGCEALLSAIAAYQERAARKGMDEARLRSQVVGTFGEILGDIAARIVEHAETMTPEEALAEFQQAFDPSLLTD